MKSKRRIITTTNNKQRHKANEEKRRLEQYSGFQLFLLFAYLSHVYQILATAAFEIIYHAEKLLEDGCTSKNRENELLICVPDVLATEVFFSFSFLGLAVYAIRDYHTDRSRD
jgi:hypothetical protein